MAAVVLGEADAEALLAIMRQSIGDLKLSAANAIEAAIVVEARQGREAAEDLRTLMSTLEVEIVPVDESQVGVAVAAWRRFGKGRHGAALNVGDCFAYALSKAEAAPLLFKGDDFVQTDVAAAL